MRSFVLTLIIVSCVAPMIGYAQAINALNYISDGNQGGVQVFPPAEQGGKEGGFPY